MTQVQTTVKHARNGSPDDFDLLDFIVLIARNKKLISLVTLAVGVIAAAVSLAMPNVYQASTKLLPPQQTQSGASALLSQLGGMSGIAAAIPGIKNPNDIYIGMLKSRTLADKLLVKFDLLVAYDTDSIEEARKILSENTVISAGKDGLISIEVVDTDKKRVAKIANSYVDELIKLSRIIAVSEAGQRRMFFERQLESSKDNLAQAEMTLKNALDSKGVISVDADSRAMVETVGKVRARVSMKEIEIASMRAFVTTNNPQYQRANEELMSLRAELGKLENGRTEILVDSNSNEKKQVGLENIKILRDVKYYQMLYELLAKQYEIARLDEAKDSSLIQVLDPAVEPERKLKPKRAVIVMLAMIFAFCSTIAGLFILKSRRDDTQVYADRIDELKRQLRL